MLFPEEALSIRQLFIRKLQHFCRRTLPAVIAAGDISADTAALAPPLLMELPAANLNALWLLLETMARVAGNAAVNEMDARALAEVFAPKLAWHSPPKVNSKVGRSPRSRLGRGVPWVHS